MLSGEAVLPDDDDDDGDGEGERVKLLNYLVDEVEPFKAEIAKAQTETTAQYSKLAALRFLAHLHGVALYNRKTVDELTRELRNLP